MSDSVPAPYIQPKNSLNRSIQKAEIVDKIIKRVQSMPDFKNYKDDLEVLLFVCMLVEHLVINKKNKEKMDKKDIVVSAYTKLFGQNVNIETISKNIDFLFENKRIKKVSFISIVCGTISEWFNRKIG